MRERIVEIFAAHGIDFDALTMEEQAEYIMNAIGGAYGRDNPLSELAAEKQSAVPDEVEGAD